MIWVHRCSVSWVSRQVAVGNSGEGACTASLMVHRNRLSSASPDTTRPGAIRPGLYMRTYNDWGCALFFLLGVLAKGGVDFVFFDAGSGISRLAEILLFGAVAHHAGMRLGGVFAGTLWVLLFCPFQISPRRFAEPNPTLTPERRPAST